MYAIKLGTQGQTHWLACDNQTAAETVAKALTSAGHHATVWLAGKCLTPPAIVGLEVTYPGPQAWASAQH